VSADLDALPNERELVDGDFACVAVGDLDGVSHAFILVTADVPNKHLLDGWILPADPVLLRGISRDLAAAAEALGAARTVTYDNLSATSAN